MSTSVVPGASLIIAWQLKNRRVLLVGGGEIASQRLAALLSADALVTIVAPSPLHPTILSLITQYEHRITHIDRPFLFAPSDIDTVNPVMVLTAISDVQVSREISQLCRTSRIPINVADDPPACDFYFGAIVRRGPLQVMISTNGNGPRIAALVKDRIEQTLPEDVAMAIEKIGILRQKLRERAPDVGGKLGKRRMRWMTRICNEWSFTDLAKMDQNTMDKLLDEGWEQDVILRPRDVLPHSSHFNLTLPPLDNFVAGFLAGICAATALGFIAFRR